MLLSISHTATVMRISYKELKVHKKEPSHSSLKMNLRVTIHSPMAVTVSFSPISVPIRYNSVALPSYILYN